ncbi:MATE family efflux transporter [Nonomuraea roseoviolacea]|uniref:Probable multidrug resistance protein NorM n=1 Tax=Nonomuraea roseoviolacea subsp. carminata TaxID=160689 RepID=A0ABT1K204_9ACTN|nr:MATE family efflux transporter [Nonomuraea roseoviolacea]MCP2348033.1 MATE family multidrug resistance protein [Nonomuraea roseoviolacea subsp. carminata]
MGAGIIKSAIPLFLSMVTGMLGTLVVTSVLGRHATVTLAAFAVMTAVLNPASAAVVGALRGLAPFVAPHRDEPARAVPVLRDARWLTLLVGTAGALAVLAVPPLARLTGVPPEVVAELGPLPWLLALYLLVYAAGGGATTVLVALGRSRQVLWSSLAGTFVMAGCALVLVPRLGLAGVGVAWLLSGVVGVVVANVCLRRAIGVRVGQARPRPARIAELGRVSLPLAATVLIKFGGLGVVTFAASTTSARDAAAHAVLSTLTGLIMLASLSVAQASVPEVARAQDPAGARRANRIAALVALGGTAVGALVLLVLRDPVLAAFTDDPAVRERAGELLPLMLLASAADGAQAVQGIGLTALKRSAASMLYFAAGYGLMVLAAVPVAATWGITGLWTSLAVTNLVLVVLQGTGFRRHSAQVGKVMVEA